MVVSRGYLRLSAEMVVLISMGVEEKIVSSCVWRLSTRPLTGQTDGQAHTYQCAFVTAEKVRAYQISSSVHMREWCASSRHKNGDVYELCVCSLHLMRSRIRALQLQLHYKYFIAVSAMLKCSLCVAYLI